jgi:hypothetical protein
MRTLNSALSLILLLLAAPAIWAHGGEDHGEKKPVVSAGPGVVARTARVGDYEILVKHPALEPLHEHPARVFVTRFATNEPVKDAAVSLTVSGKDKAPITLNAKPSAGPGEYEVSLPSLDEGSYNLSAAVTAGGASGTASFGPLAVETPSAASAAEQVAGARNAVFWALGAGTLLLVGATLFLALRRRAVLQPQS